MELGYNHAIEECSFAYIKNSGVNPIYLEGITLNYGSTNGSSFIKFVNTHAVIENGIIN